MTRPKTLEDELRDRALRPTSETAVPFYLRLSPDQAAYIKVLADRLGASRSDVIRGLIAIAKQREEGR
jgi:hypothetical protein